jgi:hypothetical protein
LGPFRVNIGVFELFSRFPVVAPGPLRHLDFLEPRSFRPSKALHSR